MKISSGLIDLDNLLNGLLPGDNIVWRADMISDYTLYANLLCQSLLRRGLELVYFRFSDHAPLLKLEKGVTVVEIDALKGFEHFIVRRSGY